MKFKNIMLLLILGTILSVNMVLSQNLYQSNGYLDCASTSNCISQDNYHFAWKADTTWSTFEFRCNSACSPAPADHVFFTRCTDKCWNMYPSLRREEGYGTEKEINVNIDCGVEQCWHFDLRVMDGVEKGYHTLFPLFGGDTLHIEAQEKALRNSVIDGQHFQKVRVDIHGAGTLGQSEIKASVDNTDFPNLFVHIHDADVDMKSLWQCHHEDSDRDSPGNGFSCSRSDLKDFNTRGVTPSVIFWVQSEAQLEFICDSSSVVQSFDYGLFIMDGTAGSDGSVIDEDGGGKEFKLKPGTEAARLLARGGKDAGWNNVDPSVFQTRWDSYYQLVLQWRTFDPAQQCNTLVPTTGSPSSAPSSSPSVSPTAAPSHSPTSEPSVSPTTSSPTTDQPTTSSPSTKVLEETKPANTTGPWIADDPLDPAGGAKGSSKSWGTLQTALVIGGVLAGVALLVGIGYLAYRGSQGGGSNAPVRVAVPVDQDKGLDVDIEQGMGGSKHPDNQIKMADDGPVTRDRNL